MRRSASSRFYLPTKDRSILLIQVVQNFELTLRLQVHTKKAENTQSTFYPKRKQFTLQYSYKRNKTLTGILHQYICASVI